ncbi:PilZ domain-containing protein [Dehalobacter sp. DCM]|uniref:PilZ domain-containing protein n=1 Tax=Dehalobacter sp. DCM TaxID=2907827 RepID=UPI00308164CA|nr:PilZ domain-containing protein [Dehalobacter sp. DCM]
MEEFKEKRQYFRVDMINDIPASARISSINNHRVEVEKTFPIKILDISTGGMSAYFEIDIPVTIMIINTTFVFEDEEFNLDALLVHKTPLGQGFEYGMKFLFHSNREESQVTRCINQYKIKHARFKKIELDLRKQKYIGCFVKVLDLIDQPACLLNTRRIVVATNQAAKDTGIRLGERCYQTMAKRQQACPHCRLEEAVKYGMLLEADDAELREVKCKARWLYLEDDYIIHYYL